MMNRKPIALMLICLAAATVSATVPEARISVESASSVKRAPTTLPFEKEVLALEAAERRSPPVTGGILFYGSSSVRKWKTLKDDFAGLPVVNHGFGGSTAPEALRYFDRLVVPCQPSTIVFYEGDNDLGKGRTPEQLLADYQKFADLARAKLPQTKIVYLSVKPSPKRANLIATQRQINSMLSDWITHSNDPRLSFVDVFQPMLDEKGAPRAELFGPDNLHMSPEGYKLWTRLIALSPTSPQKALSLTTK